LISDEVVDLFLPVRFYWVRRARWLKLEREGRLAHQRPVAEPEPTDTNMTVDPSTKDPQ
jgi:hypothetical protein